MKQVLNEKEITRIIRRMTHEIIEKNENISQLVFAGVQTRGLPLAKRMIENISQMENAQIELIPLDITNYRDDRDLSREKNDFSKRCLQYNVKDKTVIIVDDVMYTGRTARAAMEAILTLGRPSRIQLCVLIDRGHRELPIKADYVGKNIPTSRKERVNVKLFEEDGEDFVGIDI